jgi:hypothetical protein
MKQLITITAMLLTFAAAQAQERLPREEALKYAFFISADLKALLGTPIPTDPDIKRPVAVREGDYGGMVLPEGKLTAEIIAKAGASVLPVGQLWLVKLVPLVDGSPVADAKLRKVHVKAGDAEADVPCCALGVRKGADDRLELLVYGKETEPLLRTALKSISTTQEVPIDLEGERTDQGGRITLKFFGKYQATFMVTDPELY